MLGLPNILTMEFYTGIIGKLEMCPWDTDAPRYCQIRIDRELSLTKGNNSLKHGAI